MVEGDVKEWLRVVHSANGQTAATVTLYEENRTARWTVKCYSTNIKEGIAQERSYAQRAMVALREASE